MITCNVQSASTGSSHIAIIVIQQLGQPRAPGAWLDTENMGDFLAVEYPMLGFNLRILKLGMWLWNHLQPHIRAPGFGFLQNGFGYCQRSGCFLPARSEERRAGKESGSGSGRDE